MAHGMTIDRVAALVRDRYGTNAVVEIKRRGRIVIARARQGDLVYGAALGASASDACEKLLATLDV